MNTYNVPCPVWVDTLSGGAPTQTTATRIEGRTVVTDLGTHLYMDVWPEAACTVTETQITVKPYRWAGMPEGAHSCDTITVNRS